MVNAQTSTNEHSDGSKEQRLTEIGSSHHPHTTESMYMIMGEDGSPGTTANPLA